MSNADINMKPEIVTRKLSELRGWELNPRTVDKESFERLKEQIKRLGVYKPLLINQQNIVLGGNMRLKVFQELKLEEIICSRVLTDNEAQMMEYALCAKAIKNSSKAGDIVLDPFLGSGSTLIAAEQTNRICYGMELDPKYVDVIRKRYAQLIGRDDWETATPSVK